MDVKRTVQDISVGVIETEVHGPLGCAGCKRSISRTPNTAIPLTRHWCHLTGASCGLSDVTDPELNSNSGYDANRGNNMQSPGIPFDI